MIKLQQIIKNNFIKILISSLVGIILVSGFWLKLSTKAQSDVYVTFQVDKTEAAPGDTLTYTLYVKNNTNSNLTNVNAATSIDSKVTYVANSSVFQKGGQTFQLPDSWLNDRLNMGTMTPGQANSVIYKVTIPTSVAAGAVITSSGQIQPEGMDAQSFQISTNVVVASEKTSFLTGDVFQAVNNTLGEQNWRDQVDAVIGNVIQFKFRVVNSGNFDARDVKVHVQIPWDSTHLSNTLVSTAQATADNADPLTDTATVNLSGSPSYLYPRDGHYVIVGVTNLWNCPNGCTLSNTFLFEPLQVGNMVPNGSVEILFKADVVNLATASPSPSPSPSPSETPSPTPTITPMPTETPTPIVTPTPVPSSPTSSCSSLNATTTSGTAPLTITFTGSGSDSAGSIQQYQFNFGDNSNGQDQIVTTGNTQASHVYFNSGNFTANLIVKDSRGVWVGGGNCQLSISVSSTPAVLGATAPPILPKTGSDDGIFLALASIPTLIGGIYLYRRFKLV